MSVRAKFRPVVPRGPSLMGSLVLTMGGLTRADEVPLGPASIMRRNGAVLTGNLLKAKKGEVRIAGGIKPLDFRPGEVTAIRFPTRSLKITSVVVQDVFNRSLDDNK